VTGELGETFESIGNLLSKMEQREQSEADAATVPAHLKNSFNFRSVAV
jgi:hypothetical protein